MKETTKLLFEKAARSIDASEALLLVGSAEFSTGRAYYAMFYTAEALLNEKDLHFSKHGGVHGAFGEHYVKTGLFDPKFHRWLLNAFDQRIEGDYGMEIIIHPQDVREMIEQAREFLQAARKFIDS